LAAIFIFAGASLANAAPASMPMPGSLNSVEGQVTFDGRRVRARTLESEAGGKPEIIQTRRGEAELLLTPGSFLRIGPDSEARVTSRTFGNTAVKLVQGAAILDAQANFKNDLTVLMDGTRTKFDKKGIYAFDVGGHRIGVLRGKAVVFEGKSRVTVKGKRQVRITGQTPLRTSKLNVSAIKSSALYQWNEVRDRYESQARRSVQETITQRGHWYGPGWYWSRFWGFYTYLPSAGPYYWSPYYGPYYGPAWGDWDGDWGWGSWGWGGWDDDDGDGG
jgi:hypothetical protein